MQIFVIMQVAGFERKGRLREQRSEKRREGRDGETPPFQIFDNPLLHIDAACVHLLLKGHTGRSDAL